MNLKTHYIKLLLAVILPFAGCKKLIEIKRPGVAIGSDNIYTSDANAIATVTDIIARMALNSSNLGFMEHPTDIAYATGMSADELTLWHVQETAKNRFYSNNLSARENQIAFWNNIYNRIYTVNAGLEGVSASEVLTPAVKQQLLGELKMLRAFFYFQLVNLFGDLPLVTTTDYQQNSNIGRSPISAIYDLMVKDLTEAEAALSEDYLDATLLKTTPEKVRPTKWAAKALLARVYLYMRNYESAEAKATELINQTARFGLDTLNGVFLKNSREAIWQLQIVSTATASNPGEGYYYVLPSTGPSTFIYHVYLSKYVAHAFEPGDERRTHWMGYVKVNADTFHYAHKYKAGNLLNVTKEYAMMFRLGEQYLIRAEARAFQENIDGARADLLEIRERAGLGPVAATTRPALLQAIEHERQVELFTEWGHRWFDLKRTGRVDAVMSVVCPTKGGEWKSEWALYPIPFEEMMYNPAIADQQNPGYF